MPRGTSPAVIADRVLKAIRDNRFYVLAEDETWRRSCETRLEDIRLARNPTFTLSGFDPSADQSDESGSLAKTGSD